MASKEMVVIPSLLTKLVGENEALYLCEVIGNALFAQHPYQVVFEGFAKTGKRSLCHFIAILAKSIGIQVIYLDETMIYNDFVNIMRESKTCPIICMTEPNCFPHVSFWNVPTFVALSCWDAEFHSFEIANATTFHFYTIPDYTLPWENLFGNIDQELFKQQCYSAFKNKNANDITGKDNS